MKNNQNNKPEEKDAVKNITSKGVSNKIIINPPEKHFNGQQNEMFKTLVAQKTVVLEKKAELVLQAKAATADIPEQVLKAVYVRGFKSLPLNSNLTREQHAFNRVNSFIAFGQAFIDDYDLVERIGMKGTGGGMRPHIKREVNPYNGKKQFHVVDAQGRKKFSSTDEIAARRHLAMKYKTYMEEKGVEMDSSKRLVGTTELAKLYRDATPGQEKADIAIKENNKQPFDEPYTPIPTRGAKSKPMSFARHLATQGAQRAAQQAADSNKPKGTEHVIDKPDVRNPNGPAKKIKVFVPAKEEFNVAEGYEERKKAPGWHSDSQKNPNFDDELSNRRVNAVGKRLKSGKLSADERGSQERLKALIKFKREKGGLTGPKGKLPEEVKLDETSNEKAKAYIKGAMHDTITGKKDRNAGMNRAFARLAGLNKPLLKSEGVLQSLKKVAKKVADTVAPDDKTLLKQLKSNVEKANKPVSESSSSSRDREIAKGWAEKHPNIDKDVADAEHHFKTRHANYEYSSGSSYAAGKSAHDNLKRLRSIKDIIDKHK